MKDADKTKAQLIKKMAEMHLRITELEKSEAEHTKVEIALRESEALYRSLIETSPDPIVMYSLSGELLAANTQAAKVYGLSSVDELLQEVKTVFDLLTEEGRAFAAANFSRTLSEGHSQRNEYLLRTRNGTLIPMEINSSVVRTATGEPRAFISVIRNITERKSAELALRESEERYRTLVENANDIIFRTDETGHFTFVNLAALRITGYKEDEILGIHYPILIRPDMREEAIKFFGRQFVKEIKNTYSEYPILKKEGHEIWFGQNTQLIMEDGHVIGFQAVARDITARKRVEDALRISEEKYRLIAENMADIISVMDMNLRFIYISPSIMRIRGFTVEEAMGQTLDQVMTPESLQIVLAAFEEEMKLEASGSADPYRIRTMEVEEFRKDGSTIWVEASLSYLRDKDCKPIAILAVSRDITDRKQAEEALRESEERYRNVFENHAAVKLLIDPDTGSIIEANEAAVNYYGWSHEQLNQMKIQEINVLSPEDVEKEMEKARSRKQVYFEFRHRRADGSIRDVAVFSSKIGVREKELLHSIVHDITERKQLENSLRDIEDRYMLIMNNITDRIWLTDMNFKLIWASESVSRDRGYQFKEINPFSFEKLLAPDSLEIVLDTISKEMTPHRLQQKDLDISKTLELKFLRRDGSTFWSEVKMIVLRDHDGTPSSILGVGRDITDRKQAEKALRETQRKLTDIIEFLPDATMVIDRDGKVIAWNRAIESMTGVRAEEMLGKSNYEYAVPFYGERKPILIDLALHPDLEREKEYTSIQRTGDIIFGEAYTTALAPGDVHLSATASVLRNSRGEIISAIECIRNNTDRKRMEERLQRAEKMESLGVLAGGVAHDLNNVLGVLVGYSELLLREVPEGSRADKYAKSILQGGERAAAIIQDLLTMARRGVSASEAVNLNRIVTDFFKTPEFELVKHQHPEVLFRSQLETGLFNIKGSPVHLFKTIMNLLSNAAEAISGAGEVTITTENRYVDILIPGYENTQEGEYVVLTVSDTGSGISPADLGRIFEPFYTKKVMGRSGTGLGLAVVWGTVKDHGGYIDVHSEENKGSKFILYFPVTREALSKGDQDLSPDSYHGRGESILIVDDVEAQRLLAATILENLNYRVATVASGEAAVEYLRANGADLIVLDMIMDPGIDGLETYRRILEIRPRQKAIIVSGFAKTDRVGAAQLLGAGEYVKKPYVIEKLGIAVRGELDKA